MPKVNVYLPDELADAVRAGGIPVSAVCQRALEAAVREVRDAKLDGEIAPTLERFTDRARTVVSLASAAALAETVDLGSEHVLLGLSKEGSGVAARALAALGVTAAGITEASRTESSTADGRGVYVAALKEAFKLGHNYIGTEHVLLAICNLACTARDILNNLGANPSAVRHQVMSILTTTSWPSKSPPAPTVEVTGRLDEIARRLERIEQRLL